MEENNIQRLIDLYHDSDKDKIIENLKDNQEKVITYLNGYEQFQKQNYKEALELFEKCDSSYYLGLMYLYGLGVKVKEKKAFKLLQQELDSKANPHLAIMLLYGFGCNKDLQKAYDLVIDEANKNDIKSLLVLYKYFELNHDENRLNEISEKIINSNDFSIDFAIYFNKIYFEILLKNKRNDKIKTLVMHAVNNDDIETYEKVIGYYYDNEEFEAIVDLYKKKIKCNHQTKIKIKNARKMVKAKKLDPSIIDIKQAKAILRTFNLKMLYAGTGFGCYIVFIGLYFLYFLMYKSSVNNYSIYLILGSLFGLASIVTLFFSTRIAIKEKLDLPSIIIIFNEIASLILILISTITTLVKYDELIPMKVIPFIVIIVVHIVFTLFSLFLWFKSVKNKKIIENN